MFKAANTAVEVAPIVPGRQIKLVLSPSQTNSVEDRLPSHNLGSSGASKGRLPVLLGVTGHRDLPHNPEELAKVERSVRDVFSEIKSIVETGNGGTSILRNRLQRRWRPNRIHTPFILLSPLAEGADRLVAKIFLKEFGDDPGNQLIVPLPLPEEEYVRDFETEISRCEFTALQSKAVRVIDLGLVPGNNRECIAKPGEDSATTFV